VSSWQGSREKKGIALVSLFKSLGCQEIVAKSFVEKLGTKYVKFDAKTPFGGNYTKNRRFGHSQSSLSENCNFMHCLISCFNPKRRR